MPSSIFLRCAVDIDVEVVFPNLFCDGDEVRAGLVTAIYNKALVKASDSQVRSSLYFHVVCLYLLHYRQGARGDVVNLMSVDATRLQELCTYDLIAFSGPLQVRLPTCSTRLLSHLIISPAVRSSWHSSRFTTFLDGPHSSA